MALSISDQISQLEVAHHIVLSDPKLYPQIVESVLPIIGPHAHVELQKWGAEFLAETFGSPMVSVAAKEQMAIAALPTIKELLDQPAGNVVVTKFVVQASASIYSLIFKHIITNPTNISVWQTMAAIKSVILKKWDSAATSVRLCCIKFVQQVVQVQTPGPIADPRRPDRNEPSIALVPKDHPLIPPPRLEPEALGLLDRLLDMFNQAKPNAVLVCATLNCLAVLLRNRPSIYNKIIAALLGFNPFKAASSNMTPHLKVELKAMERTTRAVLMNIYRRNDNASVTARIKAQLERLMQGRLDILDEGAGRKRGLPVEPVDGLDQTKRRRLAAEIPVQQGKELVPGNPHTLADVFTLTQDQTLASFDVAQLPVHLAASITQGLLQHIGQQELERATQLVRARLQSLVVHSTPAPPAGALGDDEEDYEPDFEPTEDREQILNRIDALPPEDDQYQPEVAVGPFSLPQPPPLSPADALEISKSSMLRVFGIINLPDGPFMVKRPKSGLNRTAANNYDKDAWLTIITRLATRALPDHATSEEVSHESKQAALIKNATGPDLFSDSIRDRLFEHVMENFRTRIHVAISWLNEEWYNDRIRLANNDSRHEAKYDQCVLRILDGIMPFLDAKDKLLIRFLSEIPAVNEGILLRVKNLADDPERVDLCLKALQYLIMLKPPAREIALDAVEDLWRDNDDAKTASQKILQKYRPHIIPKPAPAPPKPELATTSEPVALKPQDSAGAQDSQIHSEPRQTTSIQVKTESGSQSPTASFGRPTLVV